MFSSFFRRTMVATVVCVACVATSCSSQNESGDAALAEPTPVTQAPVTQAPATSLAPVTEPSTTSTTPPVSQHVARFSAMQQALEEDMAANPDATGHIALVRVGEEEWSGAAGVADPESGEAIDASMSFRSASVTKTLVAAATYRLIESGSFTSQSPIEPLLPRDLTELLIAGGYDPSVITVGQLLTHTSGVLDFTFGPSGYVAKVLADPQHRWTRAEQIELAMEDPPVGAPGDIYHYSDTGYALLGAIIETTTGDDLGTSLRTLLDFDGLGLAHTYLESIEVVPDDQPPRVHQFFGTADTYDFDPSMDLYGGGGLVSTLDDLATFFEALFDGRVFENPDSLDAMTFVPEVNRDVVVPGDPRSYAAASGLFRSEIGDQQCWGHKGFWGIDVTTCPDAGVTIASSVSQTSSPASLAALVPSFEELVANR